MTPEIPQSVPGVCEVERVAAAGSSPAASSTLLIEVPHGATRRRHFEMTKARLMGEYPNDLEQFFFVNTDVGSIECARMVARMVTDPGAFPELEELAPPSHPPDLATVGSVLIVRGIVPRTFIDCNRVISTDPSARRRAGLTPGLPAYVSRPEDTRLLKRMHAEYQAAAAQAYETVCGTGGTALILHTYAPRTVRITEVDEGIVAAMRRQYEPANYATLVLRPEVDLITETEDGSYLAPEELVRAVRESYARIGIEAAENATYRLHRSTMGFVHSERFPGQVLCLEIRRELLAEPFTPFEEMRISAAKARRMAGPIAAALLRGRFRSC